jgi:hypothetical protein
MRTGLVSGKNGTEVALSYQLKAESDPAGIQTNRDKVKHLLDEVNFTLRVRYFPFFGPLILSMPDTQFILVVRSSRCHVRKRHLLDCLEQRLISIRRCHRRRT